MSGKGGKAHAEDEVDSSKSPGGEGNSSTVERTAVLSAEERGSDDEYEDVQNNDDVGRDTDDRVAATRPTADKDEAPTTDKDRAATADKDEAATADEDKPKNLSKQSLANSGIYICQQYRADTGGNDGSSTEEYGDELPKIVSLPLHVNALVRALVNLDTSIPSTYKKALKQEADHLTKRLRSAGLEDPAEVFYMQPAESIYWTPETVFDSHRQRMANEHIEIDAAKEIADKMIRHDGEAEPEWQTVQVNNVFRSYEEEIPGRQRDAVSDLFDSWRRFQNTQWNDIPDVEYVSRESPRPTRPKPDVTYAFPIFQSNTRLARGFKEDESVRNFSAGYLKDLRKECKEGLKTSPTTGLDTKDAEKLAIRDLSCFPWAVVEFKRDDVPQTHGERCEFQAANAAATALLYQRPLMELAYGMTPEDLPPVFAFTCIGPEVAVWVAYWDLTKQPNCRNFVRIFTTHMELTWGIYAVRLILKNLRVWATRILRPRLSACLTLLRMRRPSIEMEIIDTPPRPFVTGPLTATQHTRSGKLPATLHMVEGSRGTPTNSVAGNTRYGMLSPASSAIASPRSVEIPRTPTRRPFGKARFHTSAGKAQSEKIRKKQDLGALPPTPPHTDEKTYSRRRRKDSSPAYEEHEEEVSRILASRTTRSGSRYRVQWKDGRTTWQDSRDVTPGREELVEEFHSRHSPKPEPPDDSPLRAKDGARSADVGSP